MNRRGIAAAAAAAVLCLLAPGVRARGAAALVRPAEGQEVKGRVTQLSAKRVEVYTEEGTRDFKLADLMSVEFKEVKPPAAAGCSLLFTPSGDVLPAEIKVRKNGTIAASGPWSDAFNIATKDICGLLLPAGVKDAKLRAEMSLRGRRKDKLVLLGDELVGSFEGLTENGVRFRSVLSGDDPDEYKLEQVRALLFAELEAFEPPRDTYYVAALAGGGHVAGYPGGMDGGKLKWKTLGGTELSLAMNTVSAVRVVNGKVVFLAELKPVDVEQKAFIQGLPFVWSWRRDRDVFGKPLSLGGERFVSGLGVAAFTRLRYPLDGRYRKFKAKAGILDSVAPGGKTSFMVLVDGKEVFSTAKKPLTRGAKPRYVEADVSGGKVLDLVVDFGPDASDLGDIGGWGEARLIK